MIERLISIDMEIDEAFQKGKEDRERKILMSRFSEKKSSSEVLGPSKESESSIDKNISHQTKRYYIDSVQKPALDEEVDQELNENNDLVPATSIAERKLTSMTNFINDYI
jgi:hypothetical protein